ncbi:MAG TPA: hypothetical protein VF857_10800 [Spirochaetota bacterium]
MNDYEMIDRIVSEFYFDRSLPDEVRREIIRSKKSVLVNILKSTGKYTVPIAVVINTAFILKKFGLGISAVKIGIAMNTALVVATTTVAVGSGVIVYRSYSRPAVQNPVASVEKKTETAVVQHNRENPVDELVYKVEILPFECKPGLSDESSAVMDEILRDIIQRSGNSAAVISKNNIGHETKYVLRGSFSKIGETYYIRVKLIDTGSSQIISVINKTASNADELEKVPDSMAEELSKFL